MTKRHINQYQRNEIQFSDLLVEIRVPKLPGEISYPLRLPSPVFRDPMAHAQYCGAIKSVEIMFCRPIEQLHNTYSELGHNEAPTRPQSGKISSARRKKHE